MRNARMRIRRRPGRPVARGPVIVGLLLGLGMLVGCLTAAKRQAQATGDEPRVRVRLMAGAERVELGIDGQTRLLQSTQVARTITLGTDPAGVVTIDGKRYRGRVTLVPDGAGRVDVVNDLSIDDYLKGVVPAEVFASWPAEALKAQAVVARTYALHEARLGGANRHYDLHADVRSQVYRGIDAEKPSTNAAVDATSGVVVVYGTRGQEKIFPALFSSTCGGVTQSNADAFGSRELPPLAPRDVGDNCRESSRFTWPDVTMSKQELTRRFRAWGTREKHPIGQISGVASIEIAAKNQFGRPRSFEIIDASGKRFTLRAEQLRNAANAARGEDKTMLFSSFVDPIDRGDAVRFSNGRGWGHGVGMCQWCSKAWSDQGLSHREIITRSYPGALLMRAY